MEKAAILRRHRQRLASPPAKMLVAQTTQAVQRMGPRFLRFLLFLFLY